MNVKWASQENGVMPCCTSGPGQKGRAGMWATPEYSGNREERAVPSTWCTMHLRSLFQQLHNSDNLQNNTYPRSLNESWFRRMPVTFQAVQSKAPLGISCSPSEALVQLQLVLFSQAHLRLCHLGFWLKQSSGLSFWFGSSTSSLRSKLILIWHIVSL